MQRTEYDQIVTTTMNSPAPHTMMVAVPPSRFERLPTRAGYCCGYCRISQRIVGMRFILDHLTPRARGGIEEQISCRLCTVLMSILPEILAEGSSHTGAR